MKMHSGAIIKSLALSFVFLTTAGHANQLTYTPVNPSFGGSPLNGPFILGLASANNFRFLQNPATANQNSGPSTAQQFKNEITSALLSQIASQVSQQIIGENAANQGTFNLAGEIIQFNRANGQININITDSTTGGQTQIQIPVPNF
jgi:curli production assembly/transport component CsgF